MKIVAKLYYFNPMSSIRNNFVDFDQDINIGILHKDKFSCSTLYSKNYIIMKQRMSISDVFKMLLSLNAKFLTRTKQEMVLNDIKNNIKN